MTKPYELMVLFHPDLEIDLEKALKKVAEIVKNQEGKIVSTDIWGKRKLAYPIKKQEFAVYVYHEIELPAERISKLEGALNLADEVLRYLVSRPVPKVEADQEEPEEETEKPAKKPSTKKPAKAKAKAEAKE